MKIEIPEGTPEAACRSCRASIFWVRMPSGKNAPVDRDGTNHFATCPTAYRHRKPKDPTP
jgi:hypothetical protein